MKYYKHFIFTILCIMITCSIAGCGKKTASNGFMKGASPDTSALTFYTYNGEQAYHMFNFDSSMQQSIIDKIDAVDATKANDWSIKDVTLPIYALSIGSEDGMDITGAWSNGYWITQDGSAYHFDFDFAGLEKDYTWSDKDELHSFTYFPCARILSQNESGWDTTLLTPAEPLSPPKGITMTLEDWKDNMVTVNIINKSGAEWMYGEAFGLEVLLEDLWYDVPPASGNWAFTSIGLLIQDGETQEKTYQLDMYGDLPAGTYRLVAEGLSVEKMIVGHQSK